MPASSINTEWNKYEVALLIDAYLSYSNGKISRNEAVSTLSKRLRNRMMKLGMSISDTYRNENGIDLQMHAIKNALSDGKDGSIKASRLFYDIADLYKNDNDSFQSILSIAKIMFPIESTNDKVSKQPDEENERIPEQALLMAAESPRYVNSKIKVILEKKFPNGYRLSSLIEMKKFLRYFHEEFGYELNIEMADLDKDVKACGIVYETRVYLPELMLSSEAKMQLINYIKDEFADGKESVYYIVLFSKFHDTFLDSKIYDERMLREYIESINIYGWQISDQYICKSVDIEVDIPKKVVEFVKNQGIMVDEDQVVEGLSFLPEDIVRSTFRDGNITELVSGGRGVKFHIDNFVLSEEELEHVQTIIAQNIRQYHYITLSELIQDIRNQQPQIIDNNAVFGEIGLRKILAKRLCNRFSFIYNIISDINTPYSANDCFQQLARRDEYTIQDVTKLADDCGTTPNAYIETLLQNSCRIDANKFVSNQLIHFDTDAIDEALMRFCPKDYISIHDISPLSVLPGCDFPWTRFLLESYVFSHSRLFKLIKHSYFSQTMPIGAIVNRNSNIENFVDLATRAVVDANIELKEITVLQFLYDKGFIAQRRNEDIKKIINEARMLKTNKTN